MSNKSRIEWTDATWNPIVGCSKISPGCDNCYAERMAFRLAAMGQKKYRAVISGRHWNGPAVFDAKELSKPLGWEKPRRIFVCSMGDLFHESVEEHWIDSVFKIVELCPQHIFQILTKRPQRMLDYFQGLRGLVGGDRIPHANVWLGVTAENQEQADKRIPILLQCPAAVRFVSIEPMIGPVDLSSMPIHAALVEIHPDGKMNAREDSRWMIDWVIVGGETGPGARPMHPDWVRQVRDQCQAAGVPFFFKNFGEWSLDRPFPACRYEIIDGQFWWRVGKYVNGRQLDGREWNEFPKPTGQGGPENGRQD